MNLLNNHNTSGVTDLLGGKTATVTLDNIGAVATGVKDIYTFTKVQSDQDVRDACQDLLGDAALYLGSKAFPIIGQITAGKDAVQLMGEGFKIAYIAGIQEEYQNAVHAYYDNPYSGSAEYNHMVDLERTLNTLLPPEPQVTPVISPGGIQQ
jgi:hypothetical protein